MQPCLLTSSTSNNSSSRQAQACWISQSPASLQPHPPRTRHASWSMHLYSKFARRHVCVAPLHSSASAWVDMARPNLRSQAASHSDICMLDTVLSLQDTCCGMLSFTCTRHAI